MSNNALSNGEMLLFYYNVYLRAKQIQPNFFFFVVGDEKRRMSKKSVLPDYFYKKFTSFVSKRKKEKFFL